MFFVMEIVRQNFDITVWILFYWGYNFQKYVNKQYWSQWESRQWKPQPREHTPEEQSPFSWPSRAQTLIVITISENIYDRPTGRIHLQAIVRMEFWQG